MEKFTTEELELAKELAYKNWEDEETEIGFLFKGTWITNPFMESTGRFELKDFEAMCDYYGKENVYAFIKRILERG